jgi:hypothetical protein
MHRILELVNGQYRRTLFSFTGLSRSVDHALENRVQDPGQALSPITGILAVDVFGLVLAPSFLQAVYSLPSFGNREIRRQRLPLGDQQKYQQNDRQQRALTRTLLMFSDAQSKFS